MSDPDFNLDLLAERILRGDLPRFGAGELDAVLSWVSGSERAGAGELIRRLGTARERPDLMNRVYRHLEAELFDGERLNLLNAHLADGIDDKQRRARYRRLMTAFHPDRYPDDAAWMTPRARAINDAWRRFRSGEPASSTPAQPSPAGPAQRTKRRKPKRNWEDERKSARLTPERPNLLNVLRRRLGRIDNLPAKLLLVLAMLVLVPVAWMYFAYQPWRTDPASVVTVVEREPDSALRSDREIREPGASPAALDELAAPMEADDAPPPLDIRDPGRVWPDVLAETDLSDLDERLAMVEPEPAAIEEEAPDRIEADVMPAEEQDPPASTQPDPDQELEEEVGPGPALAAQPDSQEETVRPDEEPEVGEETLAEGSSQAQTEVDDEPIDEQPIEDTVEVATIVRPVVQPIVRPIVRPDDESQQPTTRELIDELLEGYRRSFELGELEAFLGHFTTSPRENRNRGREWFQENYQWLFAASQRRQLSLNVLDIESANGEWMVTAQFELQVDWPDRRPVHDRRHVRYTVRDEDNELRIAAIDY